MQDRNWLFTEFPELYTDNPDKTDAINQLSDEEINRDYPGSHSTYRMLEVSRECLINDSHTLFTDISSTVK